MKLRGLLVVFILISCLSFASALDLIPIGEKILSGMEEAEMNATDLAELGIVWIEEGDLVMITFERVDELPYFLEDFEYVKLDILI